MSWLGIAVFTWVNSFVGALINIVCKLEITSRSKIKLCKNYGLIWHSLRVNSEKQCHAVCKYIVLFIIITSQYKMFQLLCTLTIFWWFNFWVKIISNGTVTYLKVKNLDAGTNLLCLTKIPLHLNVNYRTIHTHLFRRNCFCTKSSVIDVKIALIPADFWHRMIELYI